MGKSWNEQIAQNGLQIAANSQNKGLLTGNEGLTGKGIAAKFTLLNQIKILLARYKKNHEWPCYEWTE